MPVPQTETETTRIEQRVLEIARQVVQELGARRAMSHLSPSAHLERDLGLGSLERVELVTRLEADFSVSLPELAAADARTLQDLVTALHRAGPQAKTRSRPSDPVPTLRSAKRWTWGAAASARSLPEALLIHAELDPDRPHIHLRQEEGSLHTITYGALLQEATRVAEGLRARGVGANQPVSLMLPTSKEFFSSFFGILLAGGIPVPIYPPLRRDQIEEYAQRQGGILRNAGAQLLMVPREAEILARLLQSTVPTLRGVVTPHQLARPNVESLADQSSLAASLRGILNQGRDFPSPATEAIGLIQYTSGSTGEPKGVVLTHANLLANIRSAGKALQVGPSDVGVSWLPLYHDMGLIASWLLPLYYGIPITILSPLAFLRRPERWLWAIHQHRATLSAAPNFAYELCVRKIPEEALEGLDLSCWRIAFNGAETVSPDTLERFVRRFARYGFRREAMTPVYGLAECTVALTLPPLGRGPRLDCINREGFENDGTAQPVGSKTSGLRDGQGVRNRPPLRFLSVGKPLPEHEIRIVDDSGRPCGERRQGRLQFRGPSVTSGYFRRPEATEICLHQGWWDSGDLAYTADGEIFITGRAKDIIIKAGRNLHPHEIEEIAGQVNGIRQGCVAAFGVPDRRMGTEQIVVVAEVRKRDPATPEPVKAELIEKISFGVGVPPDIVVLVPPRNVPKTSSGKLRRDACRRMYLAGTLTRRRLPAWAQITRFILKGTGHWTAKGVAATGKLAYAGYTGLVLLLTLLPGWMLVSVATNREAASCISRGWARLFLRMIGCPVRVEGAHHLQANGPCVLVANHSSYLDPVVMLAGLPVNFLFVAKHEVSRWPVVGTVIRKAGHLLVDRKDAAQSLAGSDQIEDSLRMGSSVLLYPEGTFTPATGVRPFKLGAFKAAVSTALPVLPIALAGTRRFLRDQTWLPRRGPIHMVILPPLIPKENHWREVVRLRNAARAEITRHSGEEALDLMTAGLPSREEPTPS